jgi:hypothetical protein
MPQLSAHPLGGTIMKIKSTPFLYYLVLCIVLVFIGFVFVWYMNHRAISFDRNIWLDENGSDSTLRLRMVEDLTSQYHLIGMTRGEIINLLGDPEIISDVGKNVMYYCLREQHDTNGQSSIDDLILILDDSDHVKEVKIKHW